MIEKGYFFIIYAKKAQNEQNFRTMKRIVIAAFCLVAFCSLRAQNCEAIMLPFFGGNQQKMNEYPEPKFQWRCQYSQNAFYVTDQVPEDAVMRSLGELTNKMTGQKVSPETFVVDLNTLSYYGYNFQQLQLQYPKGDVTLCFPTPGSEHAYLVLRSLDETYFRTEFPENYKY